MREEEIICTLEKSISHSFGGKTIPHSFVEKTLTKGWGRGSLVDP